MEEQQYILAVVSASGSVPGRTMLQKLVYLLARIEGDDLAFDAHFYGPYSSSVHQGVAALVAEGLLQESVEVLPNWRSDQFDLYQYGYDLTQQGRQAATNLPFDALERSKHVVDTTKRVGAWNQAPLAVAAKVDHIRRVSQGSETQDVPRLARELGWRITSADVDGADALLKALGLGG